MPAALHLLSSVFLGALVPASLRAKVDQRHQVTVVGLLLAPDVCVPLGVPQTPAGGATYLSPTAGHVTTAAWAHNALDNRHTRRVINYFKYLVQVN